MALITIIAGDHMVNGLSDGDSTVVTRGTVVHDARVIKPGAGKGRGVMTYRAVFRGRQVIQRLAGGGNAIVA